MPVLLDDHDADLPLRPGTTKSDIAAFLYRHPDWGYSPQEVTEELDVPRGTATTTLARLRDEGLVGKTDDGYYHAIDDRSDVRRYVASLDQVDRLFGRHRDDDVTPEEPEKRIGEDRTNDELDAELDALEAERDESDE
ncbi:winged helix-turn-helix domain-containing protein [Halorubrum rutilum]|uniref:Winged helix-turn-helix domain-containing protein n=1 Tax=Halorubrum rutilum TaxID=1364933 RepID=A0ABD6AI36_9EURY|nr:winged helix-turn-helix domain-containing protein [Halorubrum rutilum]